MSRPNQPHERQNNGGNAGGRFQEMSQKVQDTASAVGDQVRDHYDDARESLAHGYRQAEGMVARNPSQSVLVGFGVGFGLGVLLTVLLTQREERPWYDRYVPDSLRDIPDRLRNLHIPDSIASRIPGR